MKPLAGKTAVVTGASRGGGRGIALVLAQAGATVYLTGRSTRNSTTRADLPGTTIDDTAEEIAARGGVGIPVRTDHTSEDDVRRLYAQVEAEQGQLDLLVNNAWGGYEDGSGADPADFDAPFWRQPLSRWHTMLMAGVHATYLSSFLGAPLLMRTGAGLLVNISLDFAWEVGDLDDHDLINVPYETSKVAINRMTFGMAHNLRPHGVAAVAVSPGWMRTESVLAMFERGEHAPNQLSETESVEYVGRAVLALATDPRVVEKAGRVLRAGTLAREYGFTDVDGTQPR